MFFWKKSLNFFLVRKASTILKMELLFFAELADELLLYLNLYTDAIRFENEGR